MKINKIITIGALLLLTTNIFSQNFEQRLDSLEFEINKLEENQTILISKLDLHQSQYKAGQRTAIAGLIISALSTVSYIANGNEIVFLAGNTAGTILGVGGFIMSYRSFNFLKRDFNYKKYFNDRPYLIEPGEEKVSRLNESSSRE